MGWVSKAASRNRCLGAQVLQLCPWCTEGVTEFSSTGEMQLERIEGDVVPSASLLVQTQRLCREPCPAPQAMGWRGNQQGREGHAPPPHARREGSLQGAGLWNWEQDML